MRRERPEGQGPTVRDVAIQAFSLTLTGTNSTLSSTLKSFQAFDFQPGETVKVTVEGEQRGAVLNGQCSQVRV